MVKATLINLHHIFLSPQKFFKNALENKIHSRKELIIFIAFTIILVTILNLATPNNLRQYMALTNSSIQILGYITGVIILIIFRIYFISISLSKLESDIDTKNIGYISAISLFPNIIFMLIAIVFSIDNNILMIIANVWGAFLILAGISALSGIGYYKAFWLVTTMFLFESMIKLFIG